MDMSSLPRTPTSDPTTEVKRAASAGRTIGAATLSAERPTKGSGPVRKTDPAVRFIMWLTRDYGSVAMMELEVAADLGTDTLRQWQYRVPNSRWGPHISTVRRALNALGYDLAIVPLADRREEPPKCKVCGVPIQSAELCADCAKGNDPFVSSKYRDRP